MIKTYALVHAQLNQLLQLSQLLNQALQQTSQHQVPQLLSHRPAQLLSHRPAQQLNQHPAQLLSHHPVQPLSHLQALPLSRLQALPHNLPQLRLLLNSKVNNICTNNQLDAHIPFFKQLKFQVVSNLILIQMGVSKVT